MSLFAKNPIPRGLRCLALLGAMAMGSVASGFQGDILTPWDLQQGDGFGSSSDLSDKWLLVGSPLDDFRGKDSGSVAAFRNTREGWVQRDILAAPGGRPGDRFGTSVAVSGDLVAVGAPENSDRAPHGGAVYLFQWDGDNWAQTQVLYPPYPSADDFFGQSVDVDGDTVVVGARFADGRQQNSGAVYVFAPAPAEDNEAFERTPHAEGLRHTQTLRAFTESSGAEFGFSVSLDGDVLAVGAWAAERGGLDTGAAYLFRRKHGRWHQEREMWPSLGQAGSCFGLRVRVSGGRCVIGAPWEDNGGVHTGGIYVWGRSSAGWDQEAHLKPNYPQAEGCFGISVALSPDSTQLLVGSRRGSLAVPGAGAASLYRLSDQRWRERRIWNATVPRSGDDFGLALSLNGKQAFICARRGNSDGGAGHGGCLFIKPLAPPR